LKLVKGTCKVINGYQKAREEVWNAKIIEERVSQAASTPSTKVLIEMDQMIPLP
jgi:hypothetical protein